MPLIPKQEPPYYTTDGVQPNTTVTITNAQILTLPTTPIQVIEAPGINKAILLTNAILKFTNAADYGNVTSNALILQGSSTPFNLKQLVFPYVGLADGEPISYSITEPYGDTNYALPDQINNVGISIASQNTGNFTDGDTANKFELQLFYKIINL